MTANPSPGHVLGDADLIRYLDGEMDAGERTRVEAVLSADSALAERLSTLRRRAERLRMLLSDADPSDAVIEAANPARTTAAADAVGPGTGPAADHTDTAPSARLGDVRSMRAARDDRVKRAPRRAGNVQWLRAAAIVFALLGAGLLVPPVRAWIVDRLEAILPGEGPAAEMSPDLTSPVPGAPVAYGIPVTGSMLEIVVDAAQSGGELVVVVADVADASLEPSTGDAGDPVLVLPGDSRVRIQNETGSTSSYRLTVPPSVTRLRVRIGRGEVRTVVPGPAGADITIPLSGAGV